MFLVNDHKLKSIYCERNKRNEYIHPILSWCVSSIYYFEKSGAGRFPPLMPDSIDDFRQTSANAVDGEVRKERKDVT